MSRTDWICLGFILLGILLFLVGANVYNAYVGWLGVLFFFGAIAAWIILYLYVRFVKREPQMAQNP
ncbi:MAG: hypothetical protein ACE14S_03100 [Candidatus Bathyarchaeia archaeon]